MPSLRIVSMLPSATEMIYALGLGDSLVAVSHECDYPSEARSRPKAVKNRFPTNGVKSKSIDRRVAQALRRKESLYAIDLDVLADARPDLIITQELCDVCAITGTDLAIALHKLGISPRILTQTPRGLKGIFSDIQELGKALGAPSEAGILVSKLEKRLENLKRKIPKVRRPAVYAMEWLDPPYAAGHWVPELVEIAGGREMLGNPSKDSKRISWTEVAKADPEVIVLMPCGFDTRRTLEEAKRLREIPAWRKLRAVRDGRIYAVNANAYFSRPGPRTVEGAELLAHIFFPEDIAWAGPAGAFARYAVLS